MALKFLTHNISGIGGVTTLQWLNLPVPVQHFALVINLKALLQVFDFETRIFWLSCHDVFVLKTMLEIDFQFVHAFAIYYKAESHRKVYSVSLRSNFYFMTEKVPSSL